MVQSHDNYGRYLPSKSRKTKGERRYCSNRQPQAGIVAPAWLLIASGKKPQVLLGFNDPSEVILEKDFEELWVKVTVVTKGFVTQADVFLNGEYDYIYTCGPIPMLKAIYNGSNVSGQYSFEERMGCGFGACMGCSCKTKYGNKRICKDGPVLVKEEIIW